MIPPQNSNRTHRRGPTIVDCALALSVIGGLAFVTVRIMTIGTPPAAPGLAAADTAVAKTETPPLTPDAADVKTP